MLQKTIASIKSCGIRCTLRGITAALFTFLIAFAPSGNRIIFKTGSILGHPVEPGTVSVFGMQALAVGFIALTIWHVGWKRFSGVLLSSSPAIFASVVAVVAILSSFQADDLLAGASAAAYAAVAAGVFISIIVFRPDPREVIASFVGGALFQTAIGGWQFFTQHAFASKWLGMAEHSAAQLGAFVIETSEGRWLRAYGSLSHPNVFGLYVGIGLLACIALTAYRGHGKHGKFYAFMPIIAAGLLFSFSRSAILASAVGFVWMVVSAYGSPAAPHYKRVLVPSFMIIAATVAVIGSLYLEPIRTRVVADGRLETQSLSERGAQFDDAAKLFSRSPLTGVGKGQMPLVLAREEGDAREWWEYTYVHNVPVLVATETGLIGLGAWLGFVLSMLWIVRDRLLHQTPAASGATLYAAAFIALIVAAQFDHFLWSSWFGQLLFWTIAGLLHAAYLDIREREAKEEHA